MNTLSLRSNRRLAWFTTACLLCAPLLGADALAVAKKQNSEDAVLYLADTAGHR